MLIVSNVAYTLQKIYKSEYVLECYLNKQYSREQ